MQISAYQRAGSKQFAQQRCTPATLHAGTAGVCVLCTHASCKPGFYSFKYQTHQLRQKENKTTIPCLPSAGENRLASVTGYFETLPLISVEIDL